MARSRDTASKYIPPFIRILVRVAEVRQRIRKEWRTRSRKTSLRIKPKTANLAEYIHLWHNHIMHHTIARCPPLSIVQNRLAIGV